MSEAGIKVQYSRPVNGVYGLTANGVRVPDAKVEKQDGGFRLSWLGTSTWHRTMRAVVMFVGAAFVAKAVPMPTSLRREAGDADIAALAAASKRARTSG